MRMTRFSGRSSEDTPMPARISLVLLSSLIIDTIRLSISAIYNSYLLSLKKISILQTRININKTLLQSFKIFPYLKRNYIVVVSR